MPHVRHLAKAPIVEALLDFRVPAVAQCPDLENGLPALRDLAGADYDAETRRRFEAKIEFGPDGLSPLTKDHGFHGHFLRRKDGLAIAQFRLDGFTFNRLQPYTSWEDLYQEGMRLWGHYVGLCHVAEVSRAAVRYINRILLPSKFNDFAEFLTAPPPVPADAPQQVSEFMTRIVVHDDGGRAAIITQVLKPTPAGTQPEVVVDVDAFVPGPLPVSGPGLDAAVEGLHAFKNRLFFASITERVIKELE